MTRTPQPVPPERVDPPEPARSTTSYDWESMKPDTWQRWQDLTGDQVTNEEALRAATRIRVAAIEWGKRHGYDVKSRRWSHGRILDLRFTRRPE